MNVAVDLPKQSVRLGQRALSQTVWSFNPRMSRVISSMTGGLSGAGFRYFGRIECSGIKIPYQSTKF